MKSHRRRLGEGNKAQVVWHLLGGQKVSAVVWLLFAPWLINTSWRKLNQENKPVSETFGLFIDLDAGISSPPFSSSCPTEIQSRGKAGSRDSRRSLTSCREVAVSDIPRCLALLLTLVFLRRTQPDHN